MDKRNLFLFFTIMLLGNIVLAQATISRDVISSGGNESSTSTVQVSSTIGETITTTLNPNSVNVNLTQGFQQNIIVDIISFQLNTTKELCIGRGNGTATIENIQNCEAPYTILWSNGATGNTVSNLTEGDYSVQVTSNDGCNQVIEFKIELENDFACLLKFYSGITPNNDGFNDQWIIDNIELFPTNEVNIFNRTGNRVFQGKNYNNTTVVWGGENLSGGDLSSGTYFYTFESGSQVENGWIELTR